MNNQRPSTTPFPWQDAKRFSSGDRIWILTDTDSYESAMYGDSVPQQWYRVGGLDLITMNLGYFTFSTDDVRAMTLAAVSAAPWKQPLAIGVELTRFHEGNQEKGRFRQRVRLIDLNPALVSRGPALRGYFERDLHFVGNSVPGMWQKIECRATELRAIETAALSMRDWFAAGDVKAALGRDDFNVTPVLARLVEEGVLITNGKKKRGARYMKAPLAITERVDWTG